MDIELGSETDPIPPYFARVRVTFRGPTLLTAEVVAAETQAESDSPPNG
jgi:hypothetical protein